MTRLWEVRCRPGLTLFRPWSRRRNEGGFSRMNLVCFSANPPLTPFLRVEVLRARKKPRAHRGFCRLNNLWLSGDLSFCRPSFCRPSFCRLSSWLSWRVFWPFSWPLSSWLDSSWPLFSFSSVHSSSWQEAGLEPRVRRFLRSCPFLRPPFRLRSIPLLLLRSPLPRNRCCSHRRRRTRRHRPHVVL